MSLPASGPTVVGPGDVLQVDAGSPTPAVSSVTEPRCRCDFLEFPAGSYQHWNDLRLQRTQGGASPEQRTLAVKHATQARFTRLFDTALVEESAVGGVGGVCALKRRRPVDVDATVPP